MTHPSPLLAIHMTGEGLMAPYGPAEQAVQLVEAFDPVEIEYAAIRRHATVFDAPHRGTLVVTGPDRVSFLNRMLTQELKDLAGSHGASRCSFLLNRKGRIDADLRIIALPDRILLDTDLFAADRARAELDKYIITEDCRIDDTTAEHHRLWLHGPGGPALLARATGDARLAEIAPGRVEQSVLDGAPIIVDRWDWAGTIGLSLTVPAADAPRVYDAVSTPWSNRQRPGAIAPATDNARRIGWHALNIARIEAGTAVYMLDFGPDSLPHECGRAVLDDRVSFKKGCYLGQEIVARMQSLGKPKQKLVGLRFDAALSAQPVTGTPLVAADSPDAPVIGAVTSSCASPLLSQRPIAIAMVKHLHAEHADGAAAELWAQLDGARAHGIAQELGSFV